MTALVPLNKHFAQSGAAGASSMATGSVTAMDYTFSGAVDITGVWVSPRFTNANHILTLRIWDSVGTQVAAQVNYSLGSITGTATTNKEMQWYRVPIAVSLAAGTYRIGWYNATDGTGLEQTTFDSPVGYSGTYESDSGITVTTAPVNSFYNGTGDIRPTAQTIGGNQVAMRVEYSNPAGDSVQNPSAAVVLTPQALDTPHSTNSPGTYTVGYRGVFNHNFKLTKMRFRTNMSSTGTAYSVGLRVWRVRDSTLVMTGTFTQSTWLAGAWHEVSVDTAHANTLTDTLIAGEEYVVALYSGATGTVSCNNVTGTYLRDPIHSGHVSFDITSGTGYYATSDSLPTNVGQTYKPIMQMVGTAENTPDVVGLTDSVKVEVAFKHDFTSVSYGNITAPGQTTTAGNNYLDGYSGVNETLSLSGGRTGARLSINPNGYAGWGRGFQKVPEVWTRHYWKRVYTDYAQPCVRFQRADSSWNWVWISSVGGGQTATVNLRINATDFVLGSFNFTTTNNSWYRIETYMKAGVLPADQAVSVRVYDDNDRLMFNATKTGTDQGGTYGFESGAYYSQVMFTTVSTSYGHDVDDIAASTVGWIGAAPPLGDTPGPTDARVNYVLNPRVTTTTGWAFNNFFGNYYDGYSIAAVTLATAGIPNAGPYKITTALEVTCRTPVAPTTQNNLFLDVPNIALGQNYSVSCWVYNPSGGADYVELGVFFNSPGGMRTYLKDQWVRLYCPAWESPTDNTTEQLQILVGGGVAMDTKKVYVTGLLFEKTHIYQDNRPGPDYETNPGWYLPGTYFDGVSGTGGRWLGTANNSQSIAEVHLTLNQYELDISDSVGPTDAISFSQNYFATPADDEGLTDQSNVELGIGRTQPDGIGITDAVTMARALAQVKDEPMGLTDVVTFTWDYARVLADSEGVTDARTVEMTYARAFADNEGLTDPVAKLFERPVSDGIGVTDTPKRFDISGSTMEMVTLEDFPDPVLVQLVNTPLADDAGLSDVVAGEVLYARPTADNETLTDTATVGFGFGRVPTDAENLNDAITTVSSHERLPADTEGITDTITLANSVVDDYADAEGLTDQQVVASGVNRSQADNLGVTDQFNVVADVTKIDQVTMNDTVTREVSRTIADNVGLTDPQTRVEDNALTQADGLGLTDTATGTSVYVRTISDNLGMSDTANSGAGLFNQYADTNGLTDEVTTASDVVRSTADDTGLRDTPTVAQTHTRTFADGMGMTDTATKSSVVDRTIADTANLADLVNPVPDLTLNDSTQITDSRSITTSFGAADMDEASIIDNVVTVAAFGRTTTDTASTTDAVTTAADYSRTVADPANITDAVERTTGRPVNDAEGLTDQTATVLGYGRPVADSASLSDTVSQVRVYARSNADLMDLGDTLNIALSSPTAQSYIERVDLSDAVTTNLGRERTVQDNTALTDTWTVAVGRGVNPADTLGVTDSTARVLDYSRTLPEALGMTDSIGITFGPGVQDDTGLTDNVDAATLFMRTVEDVSTLADDLVFFLSRNFAEALPDTVGITDSVETFKQITRDIDDGMNLEDHMAVVGMNVIPLRIEDDVHLDDDTDFASKSPYTRSNHQYDDLGMTDSILYVVTPEDFVPFIGWGQSI